LLGVVIITTTCNAFDDLANASELTRETWIARSLPGRVLQTLAARLEYWI